MADEINMSTWPRVPKDEIRDFMQGCAEKAGAKSEHAHTLAEVLAAADYRGHYSHGLNRVDKYLRDIQAAPTSVEPAVIKETAATAWVNGNNALGPVVGKFCMDKAIEKARAVGVGMVVAKDSNHYGIAGFYSMRASDQGLLGMAFTNTKPGMVPTRAKEPALGTNPISLAAPALNGDSFVLDMATTTVAMGKMAIAQRRGLQVPSNWGCDMEGKETTDPSAILDAGKLLPLGGREETGGYKGYGLGMMVEILCGILGGAAFGPFIPQCSDEGSKLGQCYIAIDPEAFAPGFDGRMSLMIDTCRGLDRVEGADAVMVAGDPEKKHMSLCDGGGGIPYHPNEIKHMEELAKTLGVRPPKVIYC